MFVQNCLVGSVVATAAQSKPEGRRNVNSSTKSHCNRTALTCRAARSSHLNDTSIAIPQAALVNVDSVSYQNQEYRVAATLQTSASPELVYKILTDYESLPDIFHNIETCTVRTNDDGKELIQTCHWAFLIFRGTFITHLNVAEDPSAGTLAFSLVQSAFMRQFIGSWHVDPLATGGGSIIKHCLSVKPAVSPPQKIGDLTKNIFVRQVELILKDLADELAKYEREGVGAV